MVVYFNGEYMEKAQVSISPDDRGFLFADGVYEVIRVYRGRLFEAAAHMARLKRSLGNIKMDYSGTDSLPDVGLKLIELNNLEEPESYFYIQVTRGAAPRFHGFPPRVTKPTVYAAMTPIASSGGKMPEGIAAITISDSRWGRCDIKSVSLLPNVLAFQQAADNDAEEVLFLRDGVVTEGSHNSIFAVFNGIVTTAPLSNAILPGITRAAVLRLCGDLGLEIDESPIPEERIFDGEEWFISGTGSEVTPITRINGRLVRDGSPGPITRRLYNAFYKYIQESI